jgi:hypothetical protein
MMNRFNLILIMWIVMEPCGLICAFITYSILITVESAMIRIGLWDMFIAGNNLAYVHLIVFNIIMVLIVGSHFKCMTTNPGTLPKDYETINTKQLKPDFAKMVAAYANSHDEEEGDTVCTDSSEKTESTTRKSDFKEVDITKSSSVEKRKVLGDDIEEQCDIVPSKS